MKIKKELLIGGGDSIEKLIRMGIRNVAVIHSRDWRSEIGNLYIDFLHKGESFSEISSWRINYEFKTLAYTPLESGLFTFLNIYPDDSKLSEGKWKIENHQHCGFKIITHEENEAENAEELNEPKVTKSITQPDVTLEYYKKSKIFKSPFFGDEIRIYIKNENLEYIRNNKKIIKAFPLNKEIHFYGIKPEVKEIEYRYKPID